MNLYPYLIILLVSQEIIFLMAIHKLVNKLMSRNYHEYQMSDKIVKEKKEEPLVIREEFAEDLGHVL